MLRAPPAPFDLRAGLSLEVRAAMAELIAPPSPKAVHRCRVRLKRARALARVGRACAPGLSAVFNESARNVMRGLSQARDLAALSACARQLAKTSRGRSAVPLMFAASKLDAAATAAPPIHLDAVRAGLRDLLALAQVWPEASARQISKGAERVAKRARRGFRHGEGADAPPRRHEWRKREKDRLYAALILGKAWPEARKKRRRRNERLGETLGRERDVLLLIERIEADPSLAGPEGGAAHALKALRRRRERLGAKADALGARLHSGGA